MSTDKFGPYISRLMTTIIDKEQDEFVVDLSWSELRRISGDIEEFLRKNQREEEENSEETIKQLLQEQGEK
jgi:hypothetical protein|tara:strand:+ start:253 stop:465 length:213 start_codon:yes stop_codon:yes gene_type:complete